MHPDLLIESVHRAAPVQTSKPRSMNSPEPINGSRIAAFDVPAPEIYPVSEKRRKAYCRDYPAADLSQYE